MPKHLSCCFCHCLALPLPLPLLAGTCKRHNNLNTYTNASTEIHFFPALVLFSRCHIDFATLSLPFIRSYLSVSPFLVQSVRFLCMPFGTIAHSFTHRFLLMLYLFISSGIGVAVVIIHSSAHNADIPNRFFSLPLLLSIFHSCDPIQR